MEHKYKVGDRVRLAENISQELPFLTKGATGAVQELSTPFNEYPAYYLTMDPAGHYVGEDLDYWIASEDLLEPEDV